MRTGTHSGGCVAKSPWSKKRVGDTDWNVTITGDEAISRIQRAITIDVLHGGGLTLDELDLPRGIKIESVGEIDAFIKRHVESP